MLSTRWGLLPGVALLLSGCAADPAPAPAPAPALQAGSVADLLPTRGPQETPPPEELALRRSVLGALGACPAPPATRVAAPAGLVLPPGAVVTRVQEMPASVQVDGWVPLTPVQVREHFLARDGVEVVASEDEVIESETQMEAGAHDVFVKARALCPTASSLVGVVTPDTGKGGSAGGR